MKLHNYEKGIKKLFARKTVFKNFEMNEMNPNQKQTFFLKSSFPIGKVIKHFIRVESDG